MKIIILPVILAFLANDMTAQTGLKTTQPADSKVLKITPQKNSSDTIPEKSASTAISEWQPEDRYSFISSCIESAKDLLGSDSARYYCYCMQEFAELKYPSYKDLENFNDTVLKQPEWKKAIEGCGGGSWTSKDREAFLSECIPAAESNGLTKTKATNYCECMLYKIEKIYPDVEKAVEALNDETLSTPKWKAIIKGCLEF